VGKRILAAAPRDEGHVEHDHGTPRSGSKAFSARKVSVAACPSPCLRLRGGGAALQLRLAPPNEGARARAFGPGIPIVHLLCSRCVHRPMPARRQASGSDGASADLQERLTSLEDEVDFLSVKLKEEEQARRKADRQAHR
jgi:hypothetical protein